jgi:hypothetical protein
MEVTGSSFLQQIQPEERQFPIQIQRNIHKALYFAGIACGFD